MFPKREKLDTSNRHAAEIQLFISRNIELELHKNPKVRVHTFCDFSKRSSLKISSSQKIDRPEIIQPMESIQCSDNSTGRFTGKS